MSTRIQSSHGFNRNLQLVSARSEEMDVDEGTPVPCVLWRTLSSRILTLTICLG